MNSQHLELNLVLGWIGVLLGFLSGFLLGLFFHGEDWLGGYGSYRRRLYRLAHISFFGLGAVNILFYFTAHALGTKPTLTAASWAFSMGALTMPICCILMAHYNKARLFFAVPVVSLIIGGLLTLWQLTKP